MRGLQLGVVLAALMALATHASAQERAAPIGEAKDPPHAERIKADGIKNVAKLNERILRGGMPTHDVGIPWLANKADVDSVLILRKYLAGREKELVEAAGMKAIVIPMSRTAGPTDEERDALMDAMTDKANGRIFCHCFEGKDRTGVAMALYRMEVDGWTNEQALREMMAFGHNEIWMALTEYVRSYVRVGRWDRNGRISGKEGAPIKAAPQAKRTSRRSLPATTKSSNAAKATTATTSSIETGSIAHAGAHPLPKTKTKAKTNVKATPNQGKSPKQ